MIRSPSPRAAASRCSRRHRVHRGRQRHHQPELATPKTSSWNARHSVKTFTFNGNGEFIGVLVAPEADMTMNGAGHVNNDFIGSRHDEFDRHERAFQLPLRRGPRSPEAPTPACSSLPGTRFRRAEAAPPIWEGECPALTVCSHFKATANHPGLAQATPALSASAAVLPRCRPGVTPVWFPWGSLHMGTTPVPFHTDASTTPSFRHTVMPPGYLASKLCLPDATGNSE